MQRCTYAFDVQLSSRKRAQTVASFAIDAHLKHIEQTHTETFTHLLTQLPYTIKMIIHKRKRRKKHTHIPYIVNAPGKCLYRRQHRTTKKLPTYLTSVYFHHSFSSWNPLVFFCTTHTHDSGKITNIWGKITRAYGWRNNFKFKSIFYIVRNLLAFFFLLSLLFYFTFLAVQPTLLLNL